MAEEERGAGFGRLLRVDLTRRQTSVEEIPPPVRRKYVGGLAVNDWLLWQHFLQVDPKIDPLSPENVLILGVGVLTGIGFPIGTKMTWTFKSLSTGMFGDPHAGGKFGSCLKWAGYDHVVITGRAEQPVCLWIDDDRGEIRDAAHLRGKIPAEADHLIKEEAGDHRVETVLIGPGAGNGARISAIAVSRHRFAGRCGGGAVMASMNLKGASSAMAENFNGMLNLRGACLFFGCRDHATYSPEFFSRALVAVTGVEFSPEDWVEERNPTTSLPHGKTLVNPGDKNRKQSPW